MNGNGIITMTSHERAIVSNYGPFDGLFLHWIHNQFVQMVSLGPLPIHWQVWTQHTCGKHVMWPDAPCPHVSLLWRLNGCGGLSNHQPHDCLLSRLFRHISKKTSKLRVTGLCEGNSPGTGEFPPQRASNAENDSIWWRHLVMGSCQL